MAKKIGCRPSSIRVGNKCIPKSKLVRIKVWHGLISDVKLPKGYYALVIDQDAKATGDHYRQYMDSSGKILQIK